jgi:hypothetical protein
MSELRVQRRHYSFCYRPHFCLGQALARLVLERFDDCAMCDVMTG